MTKLSFVRIAMAIALAAQAQGPSITVADIEMLLSVKMTDDVIIAKASRSGKPVELSTEEMISLKKAGASDTLIRQLLTIGTAVASAQSAPLAAQATAANQREIGVYLKRGEEWVELLSEVVNFKSGGALKSLASAGVVKKDLNGLVMGQHSRNSAKTPLEFMLVAPEGVGATEYQLLRLRENKENREFRSVTGGIMNAQSGAMRDLVPFEGKRTAPRQFQVLLPANLGAGEYGFLPPGGANGGGAFGSPTGAQGKMFTFRLIE